MGIDRKTDFRDGFDAGLAVRADLTENYRHQITNCKIEFQLERERSQKLVEALKSLTNKSTWWFCYDMGYDSENEPHVKEMKDMANLFQKHIRKALEEYEVEQ